VHITPDAVYNIDVSCDPGTGSGPIYAITIVGGAMFTAFYGQGSLSAPIPNSATEEVCGVESIMAHSGVATITEDEEEEP
jgi:hypothetical protein